MTVKDLEGLRVPAAVVLVVVALFVFWPRDTDGAPNGGTASPTASVVVGEPVGAVLSTPSPTAAPTPIPTVTPAPTVTATPEPDTFTARVRACRELDGDRCRGEFDEFPRRARAFTALVTFEDARAGDTISVSLVGPVTINGGPFTLQGGGKGYYYSRMTYGDLPDGEYQLIATRNGTEVARITLRTD